jgi:hypothetical protein
MKANKKNSIIFGTDKRTTMFRIEYDSITESIHFEDYMNGSNYDKGFFVVSECVSYEDSIRFINYFKERYPFDLPDFFTIYLEFYLFCSLN